MNPSITLSNAMSALDGHLPATDVLSPRAALQSLSAITRGLMAYQPDTLWNTETARLPAPLQRLRHRARAFAQQELAPRALQLDTLPHWPVGQPPEALKDMLACAGRSGWLTDMLPAPFDSASWREYRHPLVLRSCIKVEEFSRVCGGQMLLLCAHTLGLAP